MRFLCSPSQRKAHADVHAMAFLKFEMEDNEDDETTEKAFPILNNFLQPNSKLSVLSTAQSLLEFLPEMELSSSIDLGPFNTLLIEFAEQIPYYHQSQHKLAALTEQLSGSPKLNKSVPTPYGGNRVSWLGGELRSAGSAPDPENPMAYVNTWAFIANLFERRIIRTGSHWAIVCLAEALEGGGPGASGHWTTRDIQVLSAAQWIISYGQSLFKQVLFPTELYAENEKEDDTGPLYNGKPGLSLHRWHFWREGFNAVASSEKEKSEYSEECRDVAAKAADLMEAFEMDMQF